MIGALLISVALAGDAYDVLKQRDGADCAALGSGDAVRDELLALAEGDVGPSYVPMRAAGCLVERFSGEAAVVERARVWVTEARWMGLGMLVTTEIDRFAVEDGVSIARAAVAGADEGVRARMVRRLEKSGRPEVRAVLGVDGSGGPR